MATEDDQSLLHRYAADHDHNAFAELVRRYVGLVYSAAVRQTADPKLAEEVTQLVFTRLAQRAARLPRTTILAGWLHADTRLTALQLLRGERRRRARETEAFQRHLMNSKGDPDWDQIRPVLDEVLEMLGPADRDLLLLRFFQERSWREVGAVFGLSEDAARMRVLRALSRLREFFQTQGITTTGEVLAETLSRHGAAAAPAALTALVITSALASTTCATGATLTLISMSKAKIALVGIMATTAVLTPVWLQHQSNRRLATENQELQAALTDLRISHDQALAQANAESAEQLSRQNQELAKLRSALTLARQQLNEVKTDESKQERAADAAPLEPPIVLITEAQIAAFLQRPVAEQAGWLAQLRRQMMHLEKRTEDEFTRNKELANAIRPKLEALEAQPAEFAEFQAQFVKTAIQLEDEAKLAQIRQIVEDTYTKAVAEKLDAPSRPADNVDAWALQRDALDRQATRAVQQLLSEEERARFDRAFLGIMGIDLGLTDGTWHRFVLPGGDVIFPSEQAGAQP